MATRRSTYEFGYSIEGVFTEHPLSLRVKAFTLDEATQLARLKMARLIVACWCRPHWDGKVEGGAIEWCSTIIACCLTIPRARTAR